MPLHTLMLGLLAVLGLVALAWGITPLPTAGGTAPNMNTVAPRLFDATLPDWCAGVMYAAIVVGALVPAAIMSIAAANLFTRNIYREFFRRRASPREEARVSRAASLLVKLGAVAFVVAFDQQFSIDFQLIGGVIVLQTLPAVALGLYGTWLHRYALVAGLVCGLGVGIGMLYSVPQRGVDGTVIRAHFGGSAWPLSSFGLHTDQSVYVGIVAVAVNLAVAVVLTPWLRVLRVPAGRDATRPRDYVLDLGDAAVRRMPELVDGRPTRPVPAHSREK
jgi:solute:Na+ symporter, SSS family